MDWAEIKARKLVAENGGGTECYCDEAFSARDKRDPQCHWCNFGKGAVEDFTAALQEAKQRGLDQLIRRLNGPIKTAQGVLDRQGGCWGELTSVVGELKALQRDADGTRRVPIDSPELTLFIGDTLPTWGNAAYDFKKKDDTNG